MAEQAQARPFETVAMPARARQFAVLADGDDRARRLAQLKDL
jgi:hypothetical protein